ncbi:branched-chain amino acid ABC transporter permease [Candidatus Bathyarchaeota archaeon]|jgi:branched-chain amino acid transport system permease protein|nr:branched-chain amino acid ABC transporter permease [Candidatus Bathyarchaeota archaeon]
MFPPLIKDALVYANCVTMMSIGFTLVYMISRVPNFAQSTFAVLGVYCTFTMVRILEINPYLAMPLGVLLGSVLALVVYLGVVNTLTKYGAGPIRLTISLLALQQIFLAGVQIYADYVRNVLGVYSRGFMLRVNDFRVGEFPGVLLVSTVLIVVIIVSLHLVLTRTQFGIATRATVENAPLAAVLGINVKKISLVSWMITGGLAGLAGTFLPLWFSSGPGSGGMLSTSIFAASVVGGLSSIYGAVIGGYVISLLEVWGSYLLMKYLGLWAGAYRMLIPLTLMSLILMYEPGGIVSMIEKIQDRYLKPKKVRRKEST